jgi:hypothetical protein
MPCELTWFNCDADGYVQRPPVRSVACDPLRVRALLTSADTLLIPATGVVRVRNAAEKAEFLDPLDKECSMSNVPGMDRARRARCTPQLRRRRGGPRRMEHPHVLLTLRARTEAFDGPALRETLMADSWIRSAMSKEIYREQRES